MPTDIASLDKQIAELQARKKKLLDASRAQALKDVRGVIAKYGFKAKELGIEDGDGSKTSDGKTRAKAAPKYRNPDKPAETWSGRGRKPRWVEERLKAGALLDEFLIKNN